jgi:hypothetical protein
MKLDLLAFWLRSLLTTGFIVESFFLTVEIGQTDQSTLAMLKMSNYLPAYRCAQIFLSAEEVTFNSLPNGIKEKIAHMCYHRLRSTNASLVFAQLLSKGHVHKAEFCNSSTQIKT